MWTMKFLIKNRDSNSVFSDKIAIIFVIATKYYKKYNGFEKKKN